MSPFFWWKISRINSKEKCSFILLIAYSFFFLFKGFELHWLKMNIFCSKKYEKFMWVIDKQYESKVSKFSDRSRGWPEGSLFDSYYTKV